MESSTGFHTRETSPLILNFGAGVDSTAILVGLVRLYRAGDKTARPALILFADTGNEVSSTYTHIETFSQWLLAQGFPAVTTVSRPKNIATKVSYTTIDQNCVANETLPSEAFNQGSCSIKWKHDPMGAFLVGRKRPYRQGWLSANGHGKPTKLIGYDASETLKGKRGTWSKVKETKEAHFRYPLVEWGWTRQDAVDAIAAEGLQVPVKSACALCPNQQPAELDGQFVTDKALLFRSLVVEEVARLGVIGLDKVKGLWRTGTKTRPGSWVEHAKAKGWLPSLEEAAGTTLTAEVHRIFAAKLANVDAGGFVPFRRATLTRLFGELSDASHRGFVRQHYATVTDALAAKLANGSTARLA